MMGCWHHHVVCLSDCLTLCIVALRVGVHRAVSCTSVLLAGKFLFVRSNTFAVGCTLSSSRNTHRKKRIEGNENVSFLRHRQSRTHW